MSNRNSGRSKCSTCGGTFTPGNHSSHIKENEHRRFIEHRDKHRTKQQGCDWCDE